MKICRRQFLHLAAASAGLRRLVVNAAYWTLGLEEQIPPLNVVDIVGEYQPSPYRPGGYVKGVLPSSLKMP